MPGTRKRHLRSADAPVRALGYLRVSTDGQVETGNGLDAQRAALTERAAREDWQLQFVADEGLSAKDMDRPALLDALDRLDAGHADVLVAAKLDRISRSVADFAALLDRAQRNSWRLVLLDLGVDTSSPAGEFVANTIANSAQYERRLIGQRTKEALAARKARGERHGMPTALPRDVIERIVLADADGLSLRAIAAELMRRRIPTATGKATWHASTVRMVLNSQDAATLVAALAAGA